MRTHGTLTRWNDDRGFGFITPAGGTADVFVHISAFPHDGVRPRVGELISFEIEKGPDGRQRAVRVMRPGQRSAAKRPFARKRQQAPARWLGVLITLLAVAGLGAYGYSQYTKHAARAAVSVSDIPLTRAPPSSGYTCDGRTRCSQMTSCAEATYFIENCPNTQMDGDRDGVPCESQWCN